MTTYQLAFPQASHRDDPLTSHEAEERVTKSGQRATHAAAVFAAVEQYPGRTAEEYGEITGLGRVEAARRLSDLSALGRVYREGRVLYHGTSQSLWFVCSGIRESSGRCDVPRSTLGVLSAGGGESSGAGARATSLTPAASRAGQEASRLAHNQETRGSIPRPATSK